MKTLNRLLGLWLIAVLAAHAQQPPAPNPANTPAAPGATPAAPGNSLMSRSPDFGRTKSNATTAAASPAAPAPGQPSLSPASPNQGARPAFTPALPGGARPAIIPPGGLGGANVPPPGAGAVGPGAGGAGAAGGGSATNLSAKEIVPKGATNIPANMMRFQEADLSQVLELYAELSGKTLLKSPQVPASVKITVRNQTALSLQEGLDALHTILALNGITMIPQGEKFIKVVPPTTLPGEAAPFGTNDWKDLRPTKVPVAQVVQLKNLLPEEATSILQPFANLPNSIVGVKGSPVLILRDFAENVQRMMEILEKVDIYVPPQIDTVVIPIRYALAGEIAGVLSGLSSGGSVSQFGSSGAAGMGGGGFGGGFGGMNRGMGGGLGGGLGGGMNTLGGGYGGYGGASGSYGSGGYGSRGLGTTATGLGTSTGLGTTAGAGGAFGAGRTGFGNQLNRAVSGAVSRAGGGAGGASGDIQLIGQAKIIADERSNALLVFAEKQDLTMISNIISKLDVVLPQVRIEALILEVNLGDGKTLGVSLKQNNQNFGDLSVAGASSQGQPFLDPKTITGLSAIAGSNSVLPSGFSYFAKLNQDLDVAVVAAANDNRINVLSRPSVVTSTARPAQIFVGETRPYVTGSYYSDFGAGGSRSQYGQLAIGISLSVTPIINQEGLVVMDIAQDISQAGAPVKIDGNDVPATINRNASSYIAVRDRDTIMLGGFISTTKTKSNGGVPYLKDIPGLGMLFRSSSETVGRVELMVLIRPTVLPTPEVAALHTAEQLDKLPSVNKAVREEEEFQRKQQEKERKEQEKIERRQR